jgi:hypothetical protein
MFACPTKQSIVTGLQLLFLITLSYLAAATPSFSQWTFEPAEENWPEQRELTYINPSTGEKGTLYNESHAVLILQGSYELPWEEAKAAAQKAENLLVPALIARGFHVLIWRDLDHEKLKKVIDETQREFSTDNNARFFFYYFGHGVTLDESKSGKSDFYLVPIDAPPSTDTALFENQAYSGKTLVIHALTTKTKHSFYALEACEAGAIFDTLSEDLPPPVNVMGALQSESVQRKVQHFLTAGNQYEKIPADAMLAVFLAMLYFAYPPHDVVPSPV